jgi:hypothetical protein
VAGNAGGGVSKNAIRCLTCQATIESVHRHDFRGCDCPEPDENGNGTKVYVDGGSSYQRRLWCNQSRWLELDTMEERAA